MKHLLFNNIRRLAVMLLAALLAPAAASAYEQDVSMKVGESNNYMSEIAHKAATSSDESVCLATGTSDLTLYALKAGTATVTWPGYFDDEDTDIYHVTVGKGDATPSFTNATYTATLGQSFTKPAFTITIKTLQSARTNYGTTYSFANQTLSNPALTYTSSNPGVASVDADGNVTLNAVGETTITINWAGDESWNPVEARYTLTVQTPPRQTPQLNLVPSQTSYTVQLGEAFVSPTVTVNPSTLTVYFSSSNEDVATVSADGVVTIKAAGVTQITAETGETDEYYGASVSYTITVEEPDGSYGFRFCGIEVSGDNAADILGNGTASYDNDTKTLTINGVTADLDFEKAVLDVTTFEGILTVDVKGDNTFTKCAYGFVTFGEGITFKGWGTVTTTGFTTQLLAEEGDIVVDGPQLYLENTGQSNCVKAKSLTVKNGGNLKAKSADDANADEDTQAVNVQTLTLGEGTEIIMDWVYHLNGHFNYGHDHNIFPTEVEIGPVLRYGLQLCGTSLTDRNAADILGDGKASYDPEMQALNLNGIDTSVGALAGKGCINLEDPNGYEWVEFSGGLMVHVEGDNTFVNENYGINFPYSLTIDGPGSLTLKGDRNSQIMGLSDDATVYVYGATVNLETVSSEAQEAIYNCKLVVDDGATVNMKTSEDAWSGAAQLRDLTLGNGIGILTEGVTWDADQKKFLKDGEEAKEVTIGPVQGEEEEGLGISVCDVELTASTVNGSLGTGTYSFDPETRTITISNVTLSANNKLNPDGVSFSSLITDMKGDLTVKVVGQNDITGATQGISTYMGTLTIVGQGEDATLSMTDGYTRQLQAAGPEFQQSANLTIDNVAVTISTSSDAVESKDLNVKNGASLKMTITQPDWGGLTNIESLTLGEGIAILTEGVTWDADQKKFLKDGVAVSEVEIGPAPAVVDEKLGVYVLGKELTTSTVNGQLGTGTYSYDPQTRTMTITNAEVTTDWNTVISTSKSKLTVKVVGQNHFIGGSAIHVGWSPLTIIGEGENASLTVTNGNSAQLTADYGYENMTIDNVAISLETDTAAVMCIDLHIKNGASLKMKTDPSYAEWAVYPLCKITTLTLDEGISILTEGVTWNTDRRKFLKDGEEVSEVEIGPKHEIVLIDPELQFSMESVAAPYGYTPLSPRLINTWRVEPIEWTSSNEQVASVTDAEGYGQLTLNGIGTTVITAKFAGDDQFLPSTASYTLEVVKGYPNMYFSEPIQLKTVAVGEVINEWPVAIVEDVENAVVTYASDNVSVATIDATTGVVTPVGAGLATISATFAGNDYYEEGTIYYGLSVVKPEAQQPTFHYAVNLPQVSVRLGAADNWLPELINPELLTATFTSSDESVATVDEFGDITLNGLGETYISAQWQGNDEWQAAQTGYTLYVTQVEPVVEETDIAIESDDLTEGSESGLIGESTTYSFDTESGDSYDPETQTINLLSSLSTQQIEAIVEQLEPGSDDFNNLFNGLTVLLSGGKGTVEIECQTWGDYRLSVKVGDKEVATFEKTDRGTVIVSYDIDADTYVYIFAMVMSNPAKAPERAAARRAAAADYLQWLNAPAASRSARRAPEQEQGLAISSITVKPTEVIVTGIRDISTAATTLQQNGQTYDLQGRRISGVAQRSAEGRLYPQGLKKGIYIVDGQKKVVK